MKKELLAPAGDFETLKLAINNGCDAVYLGGKRFGARKFASNFDDEEMIKAIKYCHLYGVKIYVTVNTIIFDEEIDDCLNYLTFLHQNGVDAVIMQDIGLITLTRKVLPNLEIHASTQAHTHNINQIKQLEQLGVKRVVLAREMSLDEINKLDTNLEIEAFIHGALCVCYSGQCLFSSMLLSRSGNRGECAGICRLPFTLLEDGKEVKTEGKYLLSPKELNTTNHIKELLDSNITSFKIEGRMKAKETIGFITRMYRNLIDHYEKGEEIRLTEEEQENLMLLFNRGFTSGYLFNQSGKDLMNIKSPNHIGIKIGKVIEVNPKRIKIKLNKDLNQGDGIRFEEAELGMIVNFIYDKNDKLISSGTKGSIIELDNKIGLTNLSNVLKTQDTNLLKLINQTEEKKIPISFKVSAKLNQKFKLKISDNINEFEIEEDIIEKATGSGTPKERILDQLKKLGDTPFILKEYELDIDDYIFIPISKLNDIRRKVCQELISIRENKKKEVIINNKPILDKKTEDKVIITALVRKEEQLSTCLKENINIIYTPDEKLYLKYKDNNNVYLRLDRVMNHYKNYDNEKLLIGELGSVIKYKDNNILSSDYYLNVGNSYYIDYLRKLGLSSICLSTENKLNTIASIIENIGNSNLEVIVYGRLEAMIMKYCPLKMLVNKDEKKCNICQNGKVYELKDRNNSRYKLIQNKELTHIMYHDVLDNTNDINKLKNIGICKFRLEFFDESQTEVSSIIKNVKSYF